MKLIVAYIQPFMQEEVTDALRARKIHGVTVIHCQGFGRMVEGKAPHYDDETVELGYAPKIKIEIACSDEDCEEIVRAIRESAHTGRPGDGKILVMELTRAERIRTGEEGERVL